MAAMTTSRCPSCKKPATEQCSSCKDIKYCSKACQKSDWPCHKLLCKTFQTFQTPPSKNLRRVITFHTNAETPTWEWLPVEYAAQQEMEIVSFRQFFQHGPQKDVPGLEEIFMGPLVGGPELKYNIVFVYDDSMFINYPSTAQQNLAVRKAVRGKWKREWRGPVVAFRQDLDPETGSTTKAGDMGMVEYSELVNYLVNGREMPKDGITREDLERYGFQNFSLN